MNLLDAARHVLRAAGHPMTSEEIASVIASWSVTPQDENVIKFMAQLLDETASTDCEELLTQVLVDDPPGGLDGTDLAQGPDPVPG